MCVERKAVCEQVVGVIHNLQASVAKPRRPVSPLATKIPEPLAVVGHLKHVNELRERGLVLALLGATFLRQLRVVLGVLLVLVHELVEYLAPVTAPVELAEHVVLRRLHVAVVPAQDFWIRVEYLANHDCVHGVALVVELVLELSYDVPFVLATSSVANLDAVAVLCAASEEPVAVNLQDAAAGHPHLLAEVVHVLRANLLHGVLDSRLVNRVLLVVVRELVVVVRTFVDAADVAFERRAIIRHEVRMRQLLAIVVGGDERVLLAVNRDHAVVVRPPLELLRRVPEHSFLERLRHHFLVVVSAVHPHANVGIVVLVRLAHGLQPILVRNLPCQNRAADCACCNIAMRRLLRRTPRVHPSLEGFGQLVSSQYRLRVENLLGLVAQRQRGIVLTCHAELRTVAIVKNLLEFAYAFLRRLHPRHVLAHLAERGLVIPSAVVAHSGVLYASPVVRLVGHHVVVLAAAEHAVHLFDASPRVIRRQSVDELWVLDKRHNHVVFTRGNLPRLLLRSGMRPLERCKKFGLQLLHRVFGRCVNSISVHFVAHVTFLSSSRPSGRSGTFLLSP